ncbi:MAG: Gfo/Idh/MocA family oxidoreductase [Anaerolineae bacterium]
MAPHDISILLYILGMDPVSVTAHGTSYVAHTVEDVAHMHLVFPNNIRAHIHVSWLDPLKVRQITVVGSKKMLVYDDVAPLEKIKIYDKGVEKLPYTDTFGDFQYSYRYGDIIIPRINFSEPLRIECQHFIDCIQNGSAPQSDGRIGLKVVRILEQADRALAASRDAETAQESE